MFTWKTSSNKLILAVSVYLMLLGNGAFFSNVVDVYPVNAKNALFLLSLAVLLVCITVFIFSLFCFRFTTKPVLIIVLLTSSFAAYFMDAYDIIIDDVMIENISHTDRAETLDLLSIKMLLYFLVIGVLPSWVVYRAELIGRRPGQALLSRLGLAGGSVVLAAAIILLQGNFYASFIREHKMLRFQINPSYYLYSLGRYTGELFETGSATLTRIGLDARIPADNNHRDLVVLVVGESARADHFSLNGYSKKTNPLLEKEEIISFTNMWSCGTSTAVSVPCMFSVYTRNEFSKSKGKTTENVLDVLQRAGVNVLWLDNNSDSKGVADRVQYQSFRTSARNPVCDVECRDVGMLAGLPDFIKAHPEGDILIVLHQMGNHGPAYYKRYPAEFEKFTPVCRTNQLENCSVDEINNTYDNVLLYTDYFLSEVIAFLKENGSEFESSMIYVSDHGESLGEDGIYLHGMPYVFAPEAQTHVPMLMWFSDALDLHEEIDYEGLKRRAGEKFSHDNLFHTLLGLMELQTEVYDKSMDIIEHKPND